jgi:hypothetical protein
MDSLKVRQFIVGSIDTGAKEETRISPIDDLCTPLEFDKVRLVFLVSRRYQTMNLKQLVNSPGPG